MAIHMQKKMDIKQGLNSGIVLSHLSKLFYEFGTFYKEKKSIKQ